MDWNNVVVGAMKAELSRESCYGSQNCKLVVGYVAVQHNGHGLKFSQRTPRHLPFTKSQY